MSEKNENNNNNNSIQNPLSLEEEKLLKDAMIFLQEEYNIKKEKLKILKQESSQTKKQFQSQLQEYQKDTKLTIEKEKEIQLLFSKISKRKKRRALIIKNSFNNKFYSHLLEISTNKKKEKILKNFFSLIMVENNQEKRNIKELIEILKNEDEIKNLLYYSYKIYCDLRGKDENLFNNLKKRFDNYVSEIKELEGGEYPFDELFECLGIIFEIIECEKNIKENNIILNKLIEKKNAKFVEIKNIENRIKNYNKNIKKIQNHIKIIHSFYDNFREQNANKDKNSLKELIENIEEYKKIDFDYNKTNTNFDAITSLTFGTYCTQSEDSSMKSSTLGSKNKLLNNKLLKSNNNNINKVSKYNNFESKEDTNNNEKNNKNVNKFNKSLKDAKIDKINSNNNNKNNKFKNNILINENSKENKKNEIKENNNKNNNIYINNKYNNNNFVEIKSTKLNNKLNKNVHNKEQNKNKQNITENKDYKKKDNLNSLNEKNINNNNNSSNKIEEKKPKNDNKENKIEEEEEYLDSKKHQNNFENLNLLGSKIGQLKYREPDESVEMTMPKESVNKNYNLINTEYNFNDSSVCDEMISFNYETGFNMGRSTTNDYINKIGVKNNVILSQELYKNKLFMRRNINDFGKLKIEKSIESSTCCVSCT